MVSSDQVSIYRTPCGALASPMASLSGDGSVHALLATAGGCVVLRTRSSAGPFAWGVELVLMGGLNHTKIGETSWIHVWYFF